MSDIGTYKSMYEQIRPFAELIDNALIAIKMNQLESDSLNEFKQLVDRMSRNQPKNASERVLKILLRAKGKQYASSLTEIRDALRNAANSKSAVNRIEEIARLLEEEQNEAFAKMGSWMR